MASDRISSRLPSYLLNHVEKVVSVFGIYETPSEYLRDLIRRDAESERYQIFSQIMEGLQDIEDGNYQEITGDWEVDKKKIMSNNASAKD